MWNYLLIVVKTSETSVKYKYDCQTRNTQGIKDMKIKQIHLTNVKYLRLSTEHFMQISIFVYTHVYSLNVKGLWIAVKTS